VGTCRLPVSPYEGTRALRRFGRVCTNHFPVSKEFESVNRSYDHPCACRRNRSIAKSLDGGIGERGVLDKSEARQLRQRFGALRHLGTERDSEGSIQVVTRTSGVRMARRASETTREANAASIEVSSATRRAAGKTSTGRLFRRSTTTRRGAEANLIYTHGRVE
jgi:hypothetical protein